MLFYFEKITKTAPVDVSLPKNLSEWAIYIPTDELLQTFQLPQAKQRGFNRNTISKPVRQINITDFVKFFYFVFI